MRPQISLLIPNECVETFTSTWRNRGTRLVDVDVVATPRDVLDRVPPLKRFAFVSLLFTERWVDSDYSVSIWMDALVDLRSFFDTVVFPSDRVSDTSIAGGIFIHSGGKGATTEELLEWVTEVFSAAGYLWIICRSSPDVN